MEIIFDVVYPNRGGYHFFSVTLWENTFSTGSVPWTFRMRVLEARYVVRGQIIHHITQAANSDSSEAWKEIFQKAITLAETWRQEFDSGIHG